MSKSKTMRKEIGRPAIVAYFVATLLAGTAGIFCILLSIGSLFGREGVIDVSLLVLGLGVLVITIVIGHTFSVLIKNGEEES